jgi:hypothetical protein
MTAKKRWFALGVLLVGIAIGLVLHQAAGGTTLAQGGGAMSATPHYSVIETEGHNLIVTDNQKNALYFYTVDKGQPVGSPLHLRGGIDLNEVGGPTLIPHKSKK